MSCLIALRVKCFNLILALLGFEFGMHSELKAQCAFPQTGRMRAITYRFRPEITATALTLHVTLEFKVGAGVETLSLPTRWAGESLHSMTNLRAVSKGVSIADGPDDHTATLHAPERRLVLLAYELRKDWTGPLVNPMQFHPVLMPKYLEFTGSNALVSLKFGEGANETVNFDWTKIPRSWALATSFGTSTSTAHRCQTYSGDPAKSFRVSMPRAAFRIHRFEIGGEPAVLAVRGIWAFTDDDAITQIRKAVGIVRDFWHDRHFPYFLVTLKPYDRDHGSSDGSAFTNAFWMYVSRLDSLAPLVWQLAHEAFHEWNPGRMGAMSNEDSRALDWFWEGFTEYYGKSLVYRAGSMPVAQYIDTMNRDLRQFSVSDDADVRGPVIALWLDGAIRSESHGEHSLDDVMFDMVRMSGQPFTLARVFVTAGRYVSPDSIQLLRRAVLEHQSVPPPDPIPLLGGCVQRIRQDLPTFELGLDKAHSFASGKVVGVVEGGPAFVAGLRDGQVIRSHYVPPGDPDRIASFTIQTDQGNREIKYYPRGQTVAAWQYRLDPSRSCEGASRTER